MANVTTNFLPIKGNWKAEKVQMIASVAMAEGSGIYAVGDGTHTVVTTSSANFKGILAEPIAATDADYATSLKFKSVWVPKDDTAESEFTVISGTFTTADIGKMADFASAIGLAVDTSTHDHARITGYISSTRGTFYFNPNIE